MIGWKRDYYIFEWRVLTFEGAAADLSISTTSVVKTITASLLKFQHGWDNKGVWFSDGDGTILLRRNMEVFENLEAANLYFERNDATLKAAGRGHHGHVHSLHLWMDAARTRERARRDVARGGALLLAETDYSRVLPQLAEWRKSLHQDAGRALSS
jgi:hypothetical protein